MALVRAPNALSWERRIFCFLYVTQDIWEGRRTRLKRVCSPKKHTHKKKKFSAADDIEEVFAERQIGQYMGSTNTVDREIFALK